MSLSHLTVWHLSILPTLQSTWRRGGFYCFLPHVRQWFGLQTHCLWCSSSLFPGEELHCFFLVYRILMILIIAIIIDIIMIAIVTVNVVITGITTMKICFFNIDVFINVIINDVIVFGYIYFLNQSVCQSDIFLFPCLENVYRTLSLFFSILFQLYLEEEPLSV